MSEENNDHSQGKQTQRRLAAIMFTDMVSYSALSQKNEALALELLEEHRKILRPIFLKFSGREIDTAETLLLSFNSVDATTVLLKFKLLFKKK
jgi:class 3 adenylate cyclase